MASVSTSPLRGARSGRCWSVELYGQGASACMTPRGCCQTSLTEPSLSLALRCGVHFKRWIQVPFQPGFLSVSMLRGEALDIWLPCCSEHVWFCTRNVEIRMYLSQVSTSVWRVHIWRVVTTSWSSLQISPCDLSSADGQAPAFTC